MGFFKEKEKPPPAYDQQNYPGTNGYDDHVPATNSYDGDAEIQCPPHTTQRKLLLRIDLHVMPFLCIMYLLAFLDRVNIGNAAAYGLTDDLGLIGNQYNVRKSMSKNMTQTMRSRTMAGMPLVALTIFFVPYCLFEIPSNILLKKFKPHVWLSINMFGFGFVSIMQGLVRSYGGLLATRFFLGVFETGMFPGCFYLIGMWYRRHEAQKRYSFFFSSTTLAGAFGGLLAAAIGNMDGVGGYASWRWIFILEGLITAVVACSFFFLLPDFPEESKWLKPDEKEYVAARLWVDQGKSARERSITLKDVGRVFKDYKVLVAGFMYFGLIVPAYGYAYFAPGIILGYGYSPVEAQLHSVPPWAVAFGFCMIIATLSDATRHRFGFAIFCICIAIAGFAILISVHDNLDLQYGALFMVTMGTYSAMPIIVCWYNMNLGGHHRRAVGSAWQIGFGNIGGIIATFAFVATDAPYFVTGYSICFGFTAMSIIACTIYGIGCWHANRSRDKSPVNVGLTEYEKTELGDLSPEYRYLL